MYKHRLLTWLVLGLLLNLQGFSQSKASANAKATAQCNARAAAYLQARDACADFNQQLDTIKQQIEAYRKQREDLLQQCNNAKNAKDLAACQEVAGLSDEHIAILEQQYSTLAQSGCHPPALSSQQIAQSCADEGFTDPSAPASNQNKPAAPVLSTKTPVKSATVPSQQPSTAPQHGVQPDRSVSNTHSRPQPSPSTTGAAPAGNGFNRQSDFGGGMRGQVNTPSPAPTSVGTGSTGAGRVK